MLTAAHCFEFITVNRLLYSHLPPPLSSPSVVPVLSPRKGQSHLQSYSLPESHRTRVRQRERRTDRVHTRQHHYRQNCLSGSKSSVAGLFCTATRSTAVTVLLPVLVAGTFPACHYRSSSFADGVTFECCYQLTAATISLIPLSH